MTEQMIAKFEDAGAKRWTKGDYDRLYINAGVLGYTYQKYNTGNIKSAKSPNGVDISNSEMYRVLNAKTYVDVKDGSVHTNYNDTMYTDALDAFIKTVAM